MVITRKQMVSDIVSLGYESPILVGEGTFSKVYRAWDQENNRFVACKVSINEKLLKKEANILKRLKHPLFVQCYGLYRTGAYAVLVTEYVAGKTLGKLLKERKKLSQRQAVRVGMELADGLRYLHELPTPIYYRDLKPDNIMIREDGRVKLVDLGCTAEEMEQSVAGTKGYAAPEQFDTKGSGPFSDVYGLGRIICQMLTGSRILLSHTKGINRRLEQFLCQCVTPDVTHRIANMRYVKEQLALFERKRCKKTRMYDLYYFEKNVIKMQKNEYLVL